MGYKKVVVKKGKSLRVSKPKSLKFKKEGLQKTYIGKLQEKEKTPIGKSFGKVFSKFPDFKLLTTSKYVWIALFVLILGAGFAAVNLDSKFSGFVVTSENIEPEIAGESSLAVVEGGVGMTTDSKGVLTLQYKAVINRPVKWLKKVKITESDTSLELPRGSTNISVLTADEIIEAINQVDEYEDTVKKVDREDIAEGVVLTGNVALDINRAEGIFTKFWNWMTSFQITGNVILEEEIENEIIETTKSTIVEVANIVPDETEVAVEYYTEAPRANETELSNGRRIIISAPSELNYSDILAYSVIEGMGIKMDDLQLKLYWYEDIIEEVIPFVEEIIVEKPEVEETLEVEEPSESVEEIIETPENTTEEIIENITEETPENTTEEVVENVTEVSSDTPFEEETPENTTEEIIETPEENVIEEEVVEEVESIEEVTEETIEEETEEITTLLTGNVVLDAELEREIIEDEIEKYLNPNTKVMGREKHSVDFIPYDFDDDGFVDYIEWVVPHLSVQIYEIIYITRAEHLDTSREVIANVYAEVATKDGVYAPAVSDGEYLRVRFEEFLDSSKDITIYAKSTGSSDIVVYAADENIEIARFSNVEEFSMYKIYLLTMEGSYDTFDLRISGDSVLFDYVVDPTPINLSVPQTFSVNGRLSNSSGPMEGTYQFNFSVYENYTGGAYLWNGVMSLTTDSDGLYNANLAVSGLDFKSQYYLGIAVESDPEMTPRINLTTSPYSFMAQNVYVGGIIFDENMDASGYNITADYFIGDGSGLTNVGGDFIWNQTGSEVSVEDVDVVIRL